MHETTIIRKPLLTEKSTRLMGDTNTYSFEVDARASKDEIKSAIESLYKVRVLGVRTINRKAKQRRLRYGWVSMGQQKKAMVRLAEGDSIELF